MGRVRVVTDSTACIPPNVAAREHIEVVPLRVLFGNDAFAEGVEITIDEFHRRLKESKALPRTSQPSAGEFAQVYERLSAEGDSIVSIHISSKLSGTISSAEAAQNMLPQTNVSVVDSKLAAYSLGLVVVRAAEAANAGASHEEVVSLAEDLSSRVRLLFAVDTLEYLHKGGRIGGASAFLGSLLSVKPILTLRDGRVEPLERVRTKTKAVDRLVQLVTEDLERVELEEVHVLHTQCPEEAVAFRRRLETEFGWQGAGISEIGPVVATHTGPGAIGLTYLAKPRG